MTFTYVRVNLGHGLFQTCDKDQITTLDSGMCQTR